MLNKKILPAHMLAGYVWELWKANANVGNITGKEGKVLARIAPVSDEPDLRDSGETYILYGFAENEQGNLSVHHTGTFAMRIIAKNFAEMSTLIRILQGAFEVEDWAAQNVNTWTFRRPGFDGIRFTSICVSYVEAADASTTEGGNMEGALNLRYRYVIEEQEGAQTKVYDSSLDSWL